MSEFTPRPEHTPNPNLGSSGNWTIDRSDYEDFPFDRSFSRYEAFAEPFNPDDPEDLLRIVEFDIDQAHITDALDGLLGTELGVVTASMTIQPQGDERSLYKLYLKNTDTNGLVTDAAYQWNEAGDNRSVFRRTVAETVMGDAAQENDREWLKTTASQLVKEDVKTRQQLFEALDSLEVPQSLVERRVQVAGLAAKLEQLERIGNSQDQQIDHDSAALTQNAGGFEPDLIEILKSADPTGPLMIMLKAETGKQYKEAYGLLLDKTLEFGQLGSADDMDLRALRGIIMHAATIRTSLERINNRIITSDIAVNPASQSSMAEVPAKQLNSVDDLSAELLRLQAIFAAITPRHP